MEEITISKDDYEDFKEWQRIKNFIPPVNIYKKENWDTEFCRGYLKGEFDAKMWFAGELQKGNYPIAIKEAIDKAREEGINNNRKLYGYED